MASIDMESTDLDFSAYDNIHLEKNGKILIGEIIRLFFSLKKFEISLKKENDLLFFNFHLKEKHKIQLSNNFIESFGILSIFSRNFLHNSSFCFLSLNTYNNSSILNNKKITIDEKTLKKLNKTEFEQLTFVLLLFVELSNILIEKNPMEINHIEILKKIKEIIKELKEKEHQEEALEKMTHLNELREKFKEFRIEQEVKEEIFKKNLKNFIFILVIVCILIFVAYIKKTNFLFKKLDK